MKPLSTVNRRLGIGLRTTEDVLELVKLRHSSGTLLAVDFQKAFDSLDHSFLVKVLKKKIGPYFLQWFKTFYANVSSCVLNNVLLLIYFQCNVALDRLNPYQLYSSF